MSAKILTIASVFTLFAVMPALAQTEVTSAGPPPLIASAEQQSKPAATYTSESNAWRSDENTSESIRAALIGNANTSRIAYVTIDRRMTAKGVMDKAVYNDEGSDVGTIKDIILDSTGRAETLIVSHGGFLGLATKQSAVDYDLIMRHETDGDVIATLSKETLESARDFSYDRQDADARTRVMPQGSISVKELLKGSLADYRGNTVANTDNVLFSNGRASRVIFAYNQVMGTGGDRVALDFGSVALARIDGDYQFKMNEQQSDQFESLRKMVSN